MDSLVPNHKKKQLMPERIMEPPDGRTERFNQSVWVLRHYAKFRFDAKHTWGGEADVELPLLLGSYPAWTGVRFCPWEAQTQCYPAAQQGSPRNWWSKPSRHCSHRQTSSGTPSCCGWTCCWPPLCRLLAWSRRCLAKEQQEKVKSSSNVSVPVTVNVASLNSPVL